MIERVSEEEYEELLDLFRENNLTQYGIDKLYGEIIDRQIEKDQEIERLNKELAFERQIKKEVREYFKNHTLKYDDLMLIKPSDVFEILDKVDKENK